MIQSGEVRIAGIDEIRWEDEDSSETDAQRRQEMESSDFAQMLEADEGSGLRIREGTIVQGGVVSIVDDIVAVDIGHKCDGEIPLHEFKDAQGEVTVKVGDTIEVYLDTFEDNNGEMVLSRERAEVYAGLGSHFQSLRERRNHRRGGCLKGQGRSFGRCGGEGLFAWLTG